LLYINGKLQSLPEKVDKTAKLLIDESKKFSAHIPFVRAVPKHDSFSFYSKKI